MAARLITDFFGSGTLLDRPPAPDVPAGGAAAYWSTDDSTLYIWDGSSWQPANPPGLSVVQRKIIALADVGDGITLDDAPTEGNVLYAFIISTTSTIPNVGSGWSSLFNDTTVPDCRLNYKIVGAGETAFQAPTSSATGGVIVVYEIARSRCIHMFWSVFDGDGSTNPAVISSNLIDPILGPGLLIGTVTRQSDELPVMSGDGTADLSISDPVVGIATQTYTHPVAKNSTFSTSFTYTGTGATRRLFIVVA